MKFLQQLKRFWLLVVAWTNGRRKTVTLLPEQTQEPPPEPLAKSAGPDVPAELERPPESAAEPPVVPVIYKPAPWRKVGRFKFNRPPRPKPREKPVEPPKPDEEKKPAEPGPLVIQGPFNDPAETGLFNMNAEGIQEAWGRFYFRDTILDQLDSYFGYMRRLKRSDPENFSLFSKVGAQIAPYGVRLFAPKYGESELRERMLSLDTWWRGNKPSFGALVYAADPLGEQREQEGGEALAKEGMSDWCIFVPKFMYFAKYERPPAEFQPAPGTDVYKMTIYWDKPQDRKFAKHHKGGVPQEYGVSIDKHGKVRVLLLLCDETVRFVSRRGPKEYRGRQSFQRRRWRIPEEYTTWAADRGVSANSLLHNIFVDAVHRWEQAQSGAIRISARKGGMEAAFSLDAERVPYFFQDRDVTINNNGKRAKIFHMVRAHMRQTAKGPVPVKISMRGERQFKWCGYDILITMPGKHHVSIIEYDVGSCDADQLDKDKSYMSMGELGDRWAAHIHGAPLREAAEAAARKAGRAAG